MLGRLGVIVAALVLAPAAFAAYPTPYASQGDPGVVSTDGALRFVANPAGSETLLTVLKSDGSRLRSANVAGSFGIPMLTYSGLTGGLSYDGKMLVLQSM